MAENEEKMSRKRHKKARKMVRTLVDIIIPVYNLFDILKMCLDAIPEAIGDIPYRIIIYDNGSVPKDADEFYRDVVEEKILIIRDKENRGFPYACNKASRRGSSPFVFFLNSDVILEPDSLHILIEKMLEDSKIGVAGMKLLFPEDSIDDNKPAGKIQHAGLVTNIRGEFRHVFIGWSADHPKVNAISDIHAVTGAALMVRRDVWTKCKGFLEEYGAGCLVGDTMVFTENGVKTMDEIVPSDSPISKKKILLATKDKFEYTKIAVNNGEQPTIKIDLQKRFSIMGTPNHKVICMREDGFYVWTPISDLKLGDYVAVRFGMNIWGEKFIQRDVAYLLGLYTSEGSYEGDGRGRITITSSDDEIADFLMDMGFRHKDKFHYSLTGETVVLLKSYKVDFTEKALNKSIPKIILESDRDIVVSYLQGLFDGDGCARNDGRVTYSSSSIQLIKQVQMLLLNFGIVAGISKKGMKNRKNIGYTLDLCGHSKLFYDWIGFRLSRKQRRECLLSPMKSDVIPYQRNRFKKLYDQIGLGDSDFYMHATNSSSSGVRRDTIMSFLSAIENPEKFENSMQFHRLMSLATEPWVWLKVKKISDTGVQHTYDLHVPGSNSYIANGFVVHNTWEDIDMCLTVRSGGFRVVLEPKAVGYHYTNATAMRYNIGYPMDKNKKIFLGRWGERLEYTEWSIV